MYRLLSSDSLSSWSPHSLNLLRCRVEPLGGGNYPPMPYHYVLSDRRSMLNALPHLPLRLSTRIYRAHVITVITNTIVGRRIQTEPASRPATIDQLDHPTQQAKCL